MRSIVPSPPSDTARSSPAANFSTGTATRSEPDRVGLRDAHLDAVALEPRHHLRRPARGPPVAIAVRHQPDRLQRARSPLIACASATAASSASAVTVGSRLARVEQELDVARGAAQRRRHRGDHPDARDRRARARRRRAPRGAPRDRARSRRGSPAARPASNCGFTSSTSSASGVVSRASAGPTSVSEMNERSATATAHGSSPIVGELQRPQVRPFEEHHPGILAERPVQLRRARRRPPRPWPRRAGAGSP